MTRMLIGFGLFLAFLAMYTTSRSAAVAAVDEMSQPRYGVYAQLINGQ